MLGVPWETDLLYREELEALAEARQPGTAVGHQPEIHHPDRGPYVHDRLEREWSELNRDLPIPTPWCTPAARGHAAKASVARPTWVDRTVPQDRDEETAAMDPSEWDAARIKRFVRPGARTKLEVY